MSARMLRLSFAVTTIVLLTTSLAWALIEVGGSKEQLKLEYDVLVRSLTKESVSVSFTLTDEGRMKPLHTVRLIVHAEDGRGSPDLSLSLDMKTIEGKQKASFQLKRTLAKRAMILLASSTMDGKKEFRGGNGHAIRIIDYLENTEPKKEGSAVLPEASQKTSN